MGWAWRDGWSAFDFGVSALAVALPRRIQLQADVVLVGAGAVGQAIVDVLVSAGVSGELRVIDFGRADDAAHFADFATLVRRNSPPCFASFRRVLGGRASGRRRASIHPLILTSLQLRLSA
jgi:hypothetical protein